MEEIFAPNSKNLPALVAGWELLMESRLFTELFVTQETLHHSKGPHPRQQIIYVLHFTWCFSRNHSDIIQKLVKSSIPAINSVPMSSCFLKLRITLVY